MYKFKGFLLAGVSVAAMVAGVSFQALAADGAAGTEQTGTSAHAGVAAGANGTTEAAGAAGVNDVGTNSHGGNRGGNGSSGTAGGSGGAGVLASGAALNLTLTGAKTGGNGATGSAGGAGGNGTATALTDTGGDGGGGGNGGHGGAGVSVTGSGTVNIGDGVLATTLAGGTAAAGGGGGAAGTSAGGGAWDGSSGSAGSSGTSGRALDTINAGAGTIININTVTFNRGAAGAGTQTDDAIRANANTTLNFSGTNVVNGRLLSSGTVNLGVAPGTTINGDIRLNSATVRTTIGATQGTSGQFDNNTGGSANFTDAVLTPVVNGVGMANGDLMVLVINSTGGPTVDGAAAVTETAAMAATTATNTLVRTWSLGAGATAGFGGTDKYGVAINNNDTVLRITIRNAQDVASDLNASQAAAFNAAANLTGNDTNTDRVALNHALHGLNTVEGVRRAARQLAPDDENTSNQSADLALRGLMGVISARADAIRAQSAATGLSAGEVATGVSVWMQGFGASARQSHASSGYAMQTLGGAIGADTPLSDTVRVGASVAYATTDLNERGDRSGSGQDVNSYLGSLYGSYTGTPLHVDVTASVARHTYKAVRQVDLPGFTGTARSSFSGTQFGLGTEVGYPIRLAAEENVVLTPLATLAYTHLNLQGYTESGAGTANMAVGSRTVNSLRGGVGAKLGARLAETSGWQINGSVRAVWQHEFQGQAQQTTARFLSGTNTFTVEGQRPERNTLNLGVALDLVSDGSMTLTARYNGEFRTHYRSHGGTMQIRYDF